MSNTEILLESGTNELEILEFHIDERLPESDVVVPCHFGVNAAKVMQVIESPGFTSKESAAHPCHLGVFSLRNRVVPLLDLSVWLGMERRPHAHEVVVVTEFSQSVTGFLVSGVTEIIRLGWDEVVPPSGYIGRNTDCLIGIVARPDRFIQLLDFEHLLADLDPESMIHPVTAEAQGHRSHTALVADDSPTIRYMLRNHLQAANFTLIVTSNGREALDTLTRLDAEAKAQGQDISSLVDIVISDIEMPLMDGFSLTRQIRQSPTLRGLPVILYSSLITQELRHKGESVGADDQISKPELSKMAERALRLIQARETQQTP